jgi:acyl-CoA synthetase (AMP-forming)/AMP-acid ligase II
VVNPTTLEVLPPNEEGEILVSGPSVARGPRVSIPGPNGGGSYHRTGDLGVLRSEGLYVTGRLKDVLIVNGANIAAVDIEWLAGSQHEALNPLGAAAFSLSKSNDREVALLIEFKDTRPHFDENLTARAIRSVVAASYGVELVHVEFLPRGALPRTTSGKIRRQFVAAEYREGLGGKV